MHTMCAAVTPTHHMIASVCAVLAIFLYINSLSGELVFDDTVAIKSNSDLRPTSPWSNLLKHDFWGYEITDKSSHKSYRPVTTATFRLNYLVHGLSTFGYHGVNVLLNSVVCYVFVLVCGRVYEGLTLPTLLTGLLYTTHPLHTEPVAGIVGRAELLSALFCMLALLYYPRVRGGGVASMVTVTILCLASFLSKEQGIMTAPVCIAYDVFILNKMDVSTLLGLFRTKRKLPDRDRGVLGRAVKLGVFSLSLLLLRTIITQGSPKFSRSDQPGQSLSTPYRQLYYLYLTLVNGQLLLFPSSLRQDYRFGYIPLLDSLVDYRVVTTALFYCTLLLFGLTVVVKKMRHSCSTSFAISLLALFYLPSSNLLVQVGFVVAERVLYMPSMGYSMLVGLGAAQLINYRHRIVATISKFGIGFLIICFCIKTVRRSDVWNSSKGLYIEALKVYRNDSLMISNLAYVYACEGDTELAERVELLAIATNPRYVQPYRNYGTLLHKQERYEEAEQMYRKAIELSGPVLRKYQNTAETYQSLAAVISVGGARYNESLVVMETLASIAPDNYIAHFERGRYLLKLNRTAEAESAFNKMVTVSRTKDSALLEIGRLYLGEKMIDKAASIFQQGVEQYSHNGFFMFELGCLIAVNDTAVLEDLKLAIRYLRSVVKADPSYERAHYHLGLLSVKLNKPQKAREFFQTTVALNPGYYNASLLLSYTQYVLGNHTQVIDALSAVPLDELLSNAYFDAVSLYGNSYVALGRYDDALELYERVLIADSKNVGALNGLGALLAQLDRVEESLGYLQRVLDIDTSNKQAIKLYNKLTNSPP